MKHTVPSGKSFPGKGNSQNLNLGMIQVRDYNNITMDLTINPDFGQ